MPTSADRPESTSTPTSSAQTQSSVHARPSLTAHAGAWAIAVVAFLAGGGGLLAIVPETARFAVAGTALTLTGLGLGLLGVARARAEHQIAALGARVAELSAETETLRDNAWHLTR